MKICLRDKKGHSCKLTVKKKKMCMLNKLTSLHGNLDIVNGNMEENWIILFSVPKDPNTFLKDLIILLPHASQIHQT